MEFTFAQFIVSVIVAVTFGLAVLPGVTAYLILLERKIASWAQDRTGPNRVGLTFGLLSNDIHMGGLGQPLADGLKFLMKEDYNPGNVEKGLFHVAPILAVIPALIAWAVIPWGGMWDGTLLGFQIIDQPVHVSVVDMHIGVIYILAAGSLGVYGITVGAWAANNKYTFLGGIRATAQMLSYEIPMGLCLLCILLLAGTSQAHDIVHGQVWAGFLPDWYLFQQPLVAILFFICILAETNRAPFDLAEAEQELIGGFHTEYSAMKFAMFFLGEYIHMLGGAAFFAVLFLGGWDVPFIDMSIYNGLILVLIKAGVLFTKVILLVALMMWVRWTLPRFRFDQLMRLAWQALIPLSLALLLCTGVFVYYGWQNWMWVGNILIGALALAIAPLVPQGEPVNRRVPLAGSRFSPLPGE